MADAPPPDWSGCRWTGPAPSCRDVAPSPEDQRSGGQEMAWLTVRIPSRRQVLTTGEPLPGLEDALRRRSIALPS